VATPRHAPLPDPLRHPAEADGGDDPLRTRLALLPSPLLGPATWTPVAERLRDAGWPVTTPDLPVPVCTPGDVLRSFLASVPEADDVALVPHSNAGLYVPGLTRRRRVTACVFVDAALPPAEGRAPLAPAALYGFLQTLADPDGLLPPWTQWWGASDVDGLFPDRPARARVEAEQQRLPLEYFAASLDPDPGWSETPAAYLAFGDTYDDERRQAAGLGWPVRSLPGRHLHMLVDPGAVALAVTDLLAVLGIRR
jgi:hypothetical protein